MAETISGIISDLCQASSQTPISRSTLLALQCFLDQILSNTTTTDPEDDEEEEDKDQANPLWVELSSRNIPLSSLTNPITSAMDSSSASLSLSILACKVYLTLILSPNSPALSLFTPMSFIALLQSIRRALKKKKAGPGQSEEEPGRDGGSGGRRGNRKGKGGGRGRRGRGRVSCYDSGVDGDEEEDRGEGDFDIRVLFDLLDRLGRVLDLIHLDRFPDCLKSLVQTVAEIPVRGLELYGSSGNYQTLCDPCAVILAQVLKPEHGDEATTAAEVLKSLSPLILAIKSPAKVFALEFVNNCMMRRVKDSDGIRKAVVNLPRYLSQKTPERAEGRASAAESIMEIVRAMDLEDRVGYVEYVLKMARGKAHLRLLAVDLIPTLTLSLQKPGAMEVDGEVENLWELRCLEALVERCSDSVAGIRAKALSNLAHLLGNISSCKRSASSLKKVLSFGNDGGLHELLRKRCVDEKAAVRKATLILMTKLIDVLGGSFDVEIVKAMGVACSDPLVSIRKAAISALSEAFRKFPDRNVTTEWLHSVPRLVADNETSIQEECESLFLELVLSRVSRAGSCLSEPSTSNPSGETFETDLNSLFPEGVLNLLKEICNGEVKPWVKKICASLGKKKKLKHVLATSLQTIIKTSEKLWLSHSLPIEKWVAPPGAWLLLSELSSFLTKAVDWEFLCHHWQLLDRMPLESESEPQMATGDYKVPESESVAWAADRVLLLQTISNVSVQLPPEPAADLAHNLLKRVEGFNMHSTEVDAHVKALKTLCKRKAVNSEEAETLVMLWADQLLSKASHIIEKILSEEEQANKNADFFTPAKTSSAKGSEAASSHLVSQAISAVYTIGALVIVCPAISLKEITPVLHGIITSGTKDGSSSQIPGSNISVKHRVPSLYNHAWLTMGKICLADGKLAKRYIPLFIRELEKTDCAVLRNNIIVMMADFCVRYTALVDCYIAKITKCLRDSCELVRRQTFILLSRLLQTDYVKWRGVLFLRFLLSLVDESEKIRQLADFLFGNILKAKAPLLAYNSFVEAVYVLNDCRFHTEQNYSDNSRAESRLFSIRGNDQNSRSKRMHIYVCLLKQMAPEQLLATFAKVSAEILAAASDGTLSIEDTTGQSVLQDAFDILTCKEIRIPTNRGPASDAADMDEDAGGGDSSAAAASAVRGKVITQAVKKSLIQNTIPIFIELKRILESKNSPLIGSLMECLCVLLKDYKNEIDEILVADKQLQKELIYDMQKYEKAHARSAAAEAMQMQRPSTSAPYTTPNRGSGQEGQGGCATAPGTNRQNNGNNKDDELAENERGDGGEPKLASAMADMAAEARARSVLKEVNMGALTPPLSSIKVPKLKSTTAGARSKGDRSSELLESLRRRQSFSSDEEN